MEYLQNEVVHLFLPCLVFDGQTKYYEIFSWGWIRKDIQTMRRKKIRVILAFEFSSPLLTRSNNLFKDFLRIKTFFYYLMVSISVFILNDNEIKLKV